MSKSHQKVATRICPGCTHRKTYPVRNDTCSPDCARLVLARARANSKPLDIALKAFLSSSKKVLSLEDLVEAFDRSPKAIANALEVLKHEGFNIELNEQGIVLPPSAVKPGNANNAPFVHDISAYQGNWFKFGATGDNHLGSKHERLDVLNAAYDLYADEGVTVVFNTGNWAEGDAPRLNFHDVNIHGLDDQIDYVVAKYPARPGVTTYFVAGDDHEGWWQKSTRIEIGRYLQNRAEDAGRFDLKYLGYVEADVMLKSAKGHSWLKVMHPGGGSAYAHSYAPQKIVESFQGGEKPQVLLIGHYHKFDYCYPREVHVVQTGCTVDQSIFMRKQKIQAMVGFVLCRINQDETGVINRFQCEWLPFYDRGFYSNKRRQFGLSDQAFPALTVEAGSVLV